MSKVDAKNLIMAANKEANETMTVNWNGVEFEIMPTLGMKDMMMFVMNAVEECFTSDETYLPEVMDYAIKENLMKMYTNVEMLDAVDNYEILYKTDIVDFVINRINIQQFNEIRDAIEKKIRHRAAANVQMIYKQANDLYVQLSKVADTFSDVFDGVTQEEISGVMKALAGGKIDEAKIVKALADQYPKG